MKEQLAYQGKGHTFHSEMAAMRFAAKCERVEAAIFAPVSVDVEKAKALVAQLQSNDRAQIKEASDYFCKALETTGDALAGRFNPFTERSKMVNSTVMPMMGRVIEVYVNQFGDELETMDMSWMSYLVTDNLIGANKATIFDIVQGTEAYELENDTDQIKFSTYKGSVWENVLPEHYGAAIAVSQYIVDSDPLTSINNIVIAIRIALMKKRVEVAFQRINAGITAAISAGYTTAYTGSSIAKTLNTAYLSLITRNQTKGYGLTGSTPVVLVSYEGHRDVIEPVFEITVNSLVASNNLNGTVITRYPMTRSYSFNFEDDLGDTGSKVALILPFRRMRMANFRGQNIQSQAEIATNSQNTYGRESYNFNIDETQIQVATIA